MGFPPHASIQSFWKRAVHDTTVHHYGYGPRLVDVVAIDFEQVSIQHDQIGPLSRFDRAQLIRAAQLERRISRVAVDE
jgi:hypothetical protein